jgi:hypothetical protein
MISKLDYLSLIDLATIGIERRKATGNVQDELERWLKEELGVSKTDACNWAVELIYNEGYEPVSAVNHALEDLGLEVEK